MRKSEPSELEVVWSGALETAASRANQRPAPPHERPGYHWYPRARREPHRPMPGRGQATD